MDLRKRYFKALHWAIAHYPSSPVEHHRAFAAAVAQLCEDDPRKPQNQRIAALASLLKISGGPSLRECACEWLAYGRGDALPTTYEGMQAFYIDERFQTPGTWEFDSACQFCEIIVFGPLTEIHFLVWQQRQTYDDFEGDLKELKSL